MDLSVIIPTLNEASSIEQTLTTAQKNLSRQYQVEFILVDAGSLDDTMELAKKSVDLSFSDITLKGAKNKSLNKGAEFACGDVFFFLDADCEVPKDFDASVMSCLENEKIVGGAFEFAMANTGLSFRIIELINRIRYRLTKNYFGDQGVFCRKSSFEQVAGFSDEPIMEAAFFCRKLRRTGKLKLIQSRLISSTRRFESGGVWTVFFKDAIIWIQFLLHIDIRRYAQKYWVENEKRE